MQPGVPFSLRDGDGIYSIEIRPSGVIRINKKEILNLDFGNRWALCDRPRKKIVHDKTIALWSHQFLGYYHWIVDVLPKLCRFKKDLGEDFYEHKLCYPRILRPYEFESLAHLQIDESSIVDTKHGINIETNLIHAIASPNWHCGSPNIGLLREFFVSPHSTPPNRKLYVSRSTGRRRICVNDADVFKALEPYGFEFVEEKPRTLREQIDLFSRAECVVSPHGGAMTNMVWCQPETMWIELAETSYYPAFYKGLATSCGIRYQAVLTDTGPHHKANVARNLKADVEQLKAFINSLH